MAGLAAGEKRQVLLGVTGSGKMFTMATLTALPVLSSRQRWASTNL
jgi:excinuclease UvrABC helicase subunit UvrB